MATQHSELIHAMVLREMQEGVIRDGLWAQALVEATYDKEKAKAIYIRLRAANMQEDTKKLLVKQTQRLYLCVRSEKTPLIKCPVASSGRVQRFQSNSHPGL